VYLSEEVTIRQCTPDDVVQMADVERSVYGSAAFNTIFFRELHDLFPALLWVAVDGPKVVGHVCGAVAQGGEVGWILNLAVLAHYRRQGIGLRLVKQEIDQLLAAGVTCIKITSEPENVAAIKLYARLGFHETGRERDYYRDGLDRLILEYSPEGE
jgi:ribosomal protein S18 acetylase RimI-like enzyme